MGNARKKNFAAMLFCTFMLTVCSTEDQPTRPAGCLENRPESISGLQIEGPRPEKNVIHNMWPVTCAALETYQQRLKENPELKGTIEISLVVEFNGEVGAFSLVRNTLNDPVVEKKTLTRIRYLDFDAYGPRNSETEIIYPIRFKP